MVRGPEARMALPEGVLERVVQHGGANVEEALQLVSAALRPLMRGCTTFVVTHTLETLQLAGRVLFLENGRLAGDGTHNTLYRENAAYRALWEEGRQAQREPGGKEVS